jgi:hypothetical protein
MSPGEKMEIVMSVLGAFFMCFPLYSYWQILCVSHANLKKGSEHIQIISTRTALFLPCYAVIMYISMLVPVLFLPLQVPISIAEGYSFFCFFKMVVTNLSGPTKVIELLDGGFEHRRVKGEPLTCFSCCPQTGSGFYNQVVSALWHFIGTRTIVVMIAVIFQFLRRTAQGDDDNSLAKKYLIVAVLFTVCSLGLLANGFMSLVCFFRLVHERSENIFGVFKILLLKFSVGLIVVQGLIEEFLFSTGVIVLSASAHYSSQDRAQRWYCMVVLFEYSLLSIALYYAYSGEIKASNDVPAIQDVDNKQIEEGQTSKVVDSMGIVTGDDSFGSNAQSADKNTWQTSLVTNSAGEPADMDFYDYVKQVFDLKATFHNLRPTNTLTEPLTGGGENPLH